MTGTPDETWFDIVAVQVEIEGGSALKPLLEAMQAVREDDITTVIEKLNLALPQLQKAAKALGKWEGWGQTTVFKLVMFVCLSVDELLRCSVAAQLISLLDTYIHPRKK